MGAVTRAPDVSARPRRHPDAPPRRSLDCPASPLHRRSPGQPPPTGALLPQPPRRICAPVNLLLVVLSVDGLVPVLRPEQRCPSPYGPSEPLPLLLTLPHRVVPAPVRALARPCGRAPALALALVPRPTRRYPRRPRAGAPAYGRGLPPPP
nr:proline-rich protein HaeIII subfamily 1-like [Aegilops tauschii subsp. strangulata]